DLHIRESFLALANLNTTSLSPDVEYGTRIRPNNDVRRADVCGAYGILPCTDMTISANLQQYCDVPDCHARYCFAWLSRCLLRSSFLSSDTLSRSSAVSSK